MLLLTFKVYQSGILNIQVSSKEEKVVLLVKELVYVVMCSLCLKQ